MKKFIKLIKEKWLRQTSLTVLLIAIMVCVFIIINTIFQNSNLSPIDFTEEKIYSLSDESKEQVKNIEQNVNMYFFGYEDSSTPVILGKQYHDVNNKINTILINKNERPDLAAQFGVNENEQLVAVVSSQRNKVVDSSEMYTYDTSTYETIDITEQKLTNAILDVTVTRKPQVYFLTGHGEYGIDNELYYLAQYVTNEVNDVKNLDLLSSDIPETCDTIIIANPTKDFTDGETEKINQYIKNGGNIVWMQDPFINVRNYAVDQFKNVNSILAQYGISFSKGIVCEQASDNMISGYPDIIIPNMTYNSIVKDIYTAGNIIMLDAGKINTVSQSELDKLNVTASPFIKSTEASFYKEDINDSTNYLEKSYNDESGPFVLGETLEKKIDSEKTSTLVAYSSAFFATNVTIQVGNGYTYPIMLRNNKDLLLNTVAYLTDREDSIRIRKDTGIVTFNTATQTQDTIVKVIIFGIPIIIIIAGITVTIIRRRKK